MDTVISEHDQQEDLENQENLIRHEESAVKKTSEVPILEPNRQEQEIAIDSNRNLIE